MNKWEKENENKLGALFGKSTNRLKIHDEQ